MVIDADTKISQLIRHNPAAIDAIASINHHFGNLRNPVLRKLLASRVTIRDAARIGKCEVNEFFQRLLPLGFTTVAEKPQKQMTTNLSTPFQVDPARLTTLDVREMLANAQDPFHSIMDALKALPVDGTLLLVNSFEPAPLLKILSCKGYKFFIKYKGDLVETYITPTVAADPELMSELQTEDKYAVKIKEFAGKLTDIDVSTLEMPEPMHRVLQALSTLPEGNALLVHHRKVPHFLFPELNERGYVYQVNEERIDQIKILIWPDATGR